MLTFFEKGHSIWHLNLGSGQFPLHVIPPLTFFFEGKFFISFIERVFCFVLFLRILFETFLQVNENYTHFGEPSKTPNTIKDIFSQKACNNFNFFNKPRKYDLNVSYRAPLLDL